MRRNARKSEEESSVEPAFKPLFGGEAARWLPELQNVMDLVDISVENMAKPIKCRHF